MNFSPLPNNLKLLATTPAEGKGVFDSPSGADHVIKRRASLNDRRSTLPANFKPLDVKKEDNDSGNIKV